MLMLRVRTLADDRCVFLDMTSAPEQLAAVLGLAKLTVQVSREGHHGSACR
jgi:hypothetical protein